jgi:putative membrane protein insertion efficiency factor
MLSWIWNIPRNLLKGGVKLYQLVLSPHLGASCRFTPTCSNYAIQALNEYGAIKGFVLATYRIFRCNPWGGHGYDPPRWFGEQPAREDEESQGKHGHADGNHPSHSFPSSDA